MKGHGTSWKSESGFGVSDYIQSGLEAVKKFESLTGRGRTRNQKQPTTAPLGPTVAIPARNELLRLTDRSDGTKRAQDFMARNLRRYEAAEGSKPADTGVLGWDLVVGAHLDEFVEKRIELKDPNILFEETEKARRRRKKVEEVVSIETLKAENLKLSIKVEELTTKLDKSLSENKHMKERMDSMAQTIDMLVLNAKGKGRE